MKVSITAMLLMGMTVMSAQAAPSLKDCERIIQQSAKQYTLASNVQARIYSVYSSGYPALCAVGKNEAIPAIARIIAEKRSVRSNSCWTRTDEVFFQRLLVNQKNIIRAVAGICVAARNPNLVAQYSYPRRIFAIKD